MYVFLEADRAVTRIIFARRDRRSQLQKQSEAKNNVCLFPGETNMFIESL